MAAKADALPGQRLPSYLLLLWRQRPRRFRCLRKNKEKTQKLYTMLLL